MQKILALKPWWRPSRLQRRSVGGAAGRTLAVARSDLPARLLMPALLLAWGVGAELAWRQRRPRAGAFAPLPEPLQVAGQDVDTPRLVVRGPWLLLLWCEDRRRRRLLLARCARFRAAT